MNTSEARLNIEAEQIEEQAESEGVARREFLRRGALAGTGLAAALLGGAGCGNVRDRAKQMTGPAPAHWTPLPHDANAVTRAAHVLNRAANGPRPGDVARVAHMGAGAYLEEQLADGMAAPAPKPTQDAKNAGRHLPFDLKPFPRAQAQDTIGEDAGLTWRINSLDTQQIEMDEPDTLYSLDDGEVLNQTAQAALLRAVYSRHQLREVMADFWTNHFNIYALKNEGRSLIPTDTERVLRPHVLGAFRELLIASAHSPAMLAYLDNNQNRRRNGGENANENYARELLELHTLGVKSGYTQRDIQEVARCFTGWSVTGGWNRGQFEYDAARHDDDAKYIPFLNLTIAPRNRQTDKQSGQRDAETVLEHLAMHPTTAHFVARKLCRRFLGHAPADVVDKAASAYLANNTDIRATLRPILLDALNDPAQCKPILKRPLDYVATSLRALAADSDCGVNIQQQLATMGQPLYLWPMPDGFPEKPSSWTGSLLPRWNFALALTANNIGGTSVDLQAPLKAANATSDAAIVDTLMETTYGRLRDDPQLATTRQQLVAHIERSRREGVADPAPLSEISALLLAAPAFQWK